MTEPQAEPLMDVDQDDEELMRQLVAEKAAAIVGLSKGILTVCEPAKNPDEVPRWKVNRREAAKKAQADARKKAKEDADRVQALTKQVSELMTTIETLTKALQEATAKPSTPLDTPKTPKVTPRQKKRSLWAWVRSWFGR